MYQIVFSKRRAALVAGVFVMSVVFASPSFALDTIPFPTHKPIFSAPEKETSFFQDVSALLKFGTPSVPDVKPIPASYKTLSAKDAKLYKQIFSLQAAGKITQADKKFTEIKDLSLRGHVLYQRYMHPTAYRTNYEELRNWLSLYSDHPGADKIYSLAIKRQPKDSWDRLTRPISTRGIARLREPTVEWGDVYLSSKERNSSQKKQIASLGKSIRRDLSNTAPTRALRRMKESAATVYLDNVEEDVLRAKIASGYLYAGKLDKAYKLAKKSAKRSGQYAPLASWISGITAWRMGNYKAASKHFEVVGLSPYSSGWESSGGSYWAARAHMRTGNVRAVSKWLTRAAEHPHTFYGLIATRALGKDFKFDWKIPKYTSAHHDLLMDIAAGKRAALLVAAGQPHLAEKELLRMDVRNNDSLRDALFAYAAYAGLPALSMRLGNVIAKPNGGFYEAALYPKGPWAPKAGYKIDPSLMYAIMRQESRFDPFAQSRSGARGLMQIMPATAVYVSGSRQYKYKEGHEKLLIPEINLDIAQRYLNSLVKYKNVRGDMFSLLVAYNAGPGNLRRWKRALDEIQDPLLFIESIPVSETRAYVEHVLSNYWIYRLREDLPTPTLDSVAEGKNAKYVPYLAGNVKVATQN